MSRYLLRLWPLLLLVTLGAQVHATDLTVTCDAPTKNTDGTAISGVITYKFYGALKGATKPLLGTQSICSFVRVSAPLGNNCFEVTATGTGAESTHTMEVCSQVAAPTPAAPTPNAPGNPQVTQTPISPTAYSVIKSPEALVMLPVGTVDAQASCDGSQAVVLNGQTYHPVPVAAIHFTGTARPVVAFAICG